MATITITYNGRSQRAKLALDMLFSTGLFKASNKVNKPNKRTMAAIEEAKTGKHAGVVDVSSVEAMIRSMQ